MGSKETKLTYGLLIGAFLLACIGAYLIATQVSALTSARQELEETRTNLGDARAELAAAVADQLYVRDAVYGTSDFLAQTPLGLLCEQRPDDSYIQRLCQSQNEYMAILTMFNEATRSRTAVPRDYKRSLQDYLKFASFLESRPPSGLNNAWLARALEGVAYSQLKLRNLREAEAAIAKAQPLDPNSAIVGITALKVACAQQSEPELVQKEYAGLNQRLEARVASLSNNAGAIPIALRNAKLEIDLVEQDEELYNLCGYAGVTTVSRSM